MWALVFACEALCHESSVFLFNSGIREYELLKGRAAAQMSWAVGRFNYINDTNGIRQSAVFADHFRERWASVMDPCRDPHVPSSPANSSAYVYEVDTPPQDAYPMPCRVPTTGSYIETIIDESDDSMQHVNDMCSPCH